MHAGGQFLKTPHTGRLSETQDAAVLFRLRTRITCANNVIMRLYFALLLCASTLVAQRVSGRNGGIVYIDASGREQQITVGHDDRNPSLSLDGRYVVFVRVSNTAPCPSQPKETQVLESELWQADMAGRTQPAAIFRGSVKAPDGRPLTAFFDPQFSPSGE